MYYYLIGCDIITKEDAKSGNNNIIICYNKEKKAVEIELNENERYFQDYNYLNINAFIIEILPKDNINEKYFLFYEQNFNIQSNQIKNQKIYYIQYIDNFFKPHKDKIKSILPSEFKFTYLSNKNEIFSGSPIFLENSSKVIGIQTSILNKNEKYGYCIEPIITSLKNNLNYKENNMEIINIKKNLIRK